MSDDKRAIARELAARAREEKRPLSWFEELYQKARDEGARVPWADLVPNPPCLPGVELLGIEEQRTRSNTPKPDPRMEIGLRRTNENPSGT